MAIHHPADINIFACVCIDYPIAKPKDPEILKYCLGKLNGNFIASAEHDKTLKIMIQLEQIIGKEIIWVRGKSFDQIIDEAGCLPTWARRFCTTEMKIRPIFEYLWPRYGEVIMQIGLRADEYERRQRVKENILMQAPISCNLFGENRQNWDREIIWRQATTPLERTFHFEIIKFWKENHPEFIFPKDSNCLGCHYKSKELIKKNYQDSPAHLEWFSLQEKKGKYNTWHDDMIPYEKIFKMNFTEEISFENYTMCNSGGCTD
jgi:hypothetical protein